MHEKRLAPEELRRILKRAATKEATWQEIDLVKDHIAALAAERERLWCESWGMAVMGQACSEDSLHITRNAMEGMDALEDELARLKPSGQVAEDEALVRAVMLAQSDHNGPVTTASDALSRLAAKAQGYEAAVQRAEAAEGLLDNAYATATTAQQREQVAVADNAALVDVIETAADGECDFCEALAPNHTDYCVFGRALAQPHPGAALLEQHRNELGAAIAKERAYRDDRIKEVEKSTSTELPVTRYTARARVAVVDGRLRMRPVDIQPAVNAANLPDKEVLAHALLAVRGLIALDGLPCWCRGVDREDGVPHSPRCMEARKALGLTAPTGGGS